MALAVLARREVRAACRPLLLGHPGALERVAAAAGNAVRLQTVTDPQRGFAVGPDAPLPVLALESPEPEDPPGRPSAGAGMAAVEALLRAGELCLQGGAEILLTPPLSKESMHLAGYPFEGQTQILGELCRSRRYGMLACAERLKVWLATRHTGLRRALERLDAALVAKQLRLAHQAAREVLGLTKPRIALAGLNPHAGEGGAFGDEEGRILVPALTTVRAEGLEVAGPCVPDTVFREGAEGRWDVVVALYHDQGFLPLKMLDRRRAWTVFVGGPILRVGPMHGTAFDEARSGRADPEPFAYALERGLELARHRRAAPAGSAA